MFGQLSLQWHSPTFEQQQYTPRVTEIIWGRYSNRFLHTPGINSHGIVSGSPMSSDATQTNYKLLLFRILRYNFFFDASCVSSCAARAPIRQLPVKTFVNIQRILYPWRTMRAEHVIGGDATDPPH